TRPGKADKAPALYNIIEDYTEFDPPGNVTVCAMTEPEDVPAHAKMLAESYDVPVEEMTRLLQEGGVYVYPQVGGLLTRGVFACRVDPTGDRPKWTWILDVMQFAEAEQLVRSRRLALLDAAQQVFVRTLAPELQAKLERKNLGLDDNRLEGAVAKSGDIKFIDFRKDWSPYFKRYCIMPDGRLVATGGLREFAELHGIPVAQAKRLADEGGTLEVGDEVLACQIVNGQPAVARFNRQQYARAKTLVAEKGVHLMDALSEVGLNDPHMMRALARLERGT
ncbi:MAG: hypothetical protein ACREI3_04215, partial [Nitrospirales bacterium]